MRRCYLGAVSEEHGHYGIVFRDFPGCVSSGETLADVLAMGAEALSGHIAAMLDDGDAVPEPTDHGLAEVIDWLRDEKDDTSVEDGWTGMFPIMIEITDRIGLVTVSMRAELVRQIAEMAERTAQKLDSRDFIERAIEHELEHLRKSAA